MDTNAHPRAGTGDGFLGDDQEDREHSMRESLMCKGVQEGPRESSRKVLREAKNNTRGKGQTLSGLTCGVAT